MNRIISIAFIVLSLVGVIGISMLAFPYAAMSSETIHAAQQGREAELFDDVDLGDFGQVSVLDMMQHYIDNPPTPETDGAKARPARFQGC